jgi:HD-GYP domain-containing protein (c-di-GMP phosphodiesterase class II)
VERIELAGLLHDIGKLGIPDRILQKPGGLSNEEFELIKTHPDRGARILAWHPALEDLIPLVRHHHEAYDGRGYPEGLEGNEVPIGAAIIGVADAFDTMTSERMYQPQRSVAEALAELQRGAGTQFHPELVRRFVERVSQAHSLVFTSASSADAG